MMRYPDYTVTFVGGNMDGQKRTLKEPHLDTLAVFGNDGGMYNIHRIKDLHAQGGYAFYAFPSNMRVKIIGATRIANIYLPPEGVEYTWKSLELELIKAAIGDNCFPLFIHRVIEQSSQFPDSYRYYIESLAIDRS